MVEFTGQTWFEPSLETSDKWQRRGAWCVPSAPRPRSADCPDARSGAAPSVGLLRPGQALVPFGKWVSQV